MRAWFVAGAVLAGAYELGRRKGRVETLRSVIRLARAER
jgi:hypothetical protein